MSEMNKLDVNILSEVAGGTSSGGDVPFNIIVYLDGSYVCDVIAASSPETLMRMHRASIAHQNRVPLSQVHLYMPDNTEIDYNASLAANGITENMNVIAYVTR